LVDGSAESFEAPDERMGHVTSGRQTALANTPVVSARQPADAVVMINRETLALMKPSAILVNTGRGALVDEEALCEALDRGHLFGAALDVFKAEPLPTSSPLLKYENVLLCTHMGGLDTESTAAMANLAAQCIVDLAHGRWPEACVVNKELRDRYKW